MKNSKFEKLVTQGIIEEIAECCEKDETYQKLLKEEDLLYGKLSVELSEEQSKELEKYKEAVAAASLQKAIIAYTKGINDLYTLFKSYLGINPACHNEMQAKIKRRSKARRPANVRIGRLVWPRLSSVRRHPRKSNQK